MLAGLPVGGVEVGVGEVRRVQRGVGQDLENAGALEVVGDVLRDHNAVLGLAAKGLADLGDVHKRLLDGEAGLEGAETVSELQLRHALAVGGGDLGDLEHECLLGAVGQGQHVADGVGSEGRAIHLEAVIAAIIR